VIAAAVVYANALTGPFIFDDFDAIVENPHVRRLWPLSEAISAPPQSTVAGRPLVSLSLALNYAWGGLEVRGYHLTNIAIHLLCALLLYGIVARTLGGTASRDAPRRGPPGLAAACALIWLVHPLCTETVNYVVQRTESMMALFAAIRAWDSNRVTAWSVAAVLACVAGMLSKESMVTAPVAVLLYDLAYRPGPPGAIVRRRWPLYAGLAAGWIVLAAIMLGGPRSDTVGLSLGVGALAYAENQALLILGYLKTALWPNPLVIDYGYARPLAHGIATPYVWGVLLLACAVAMLFVRRPALGYPALWVFLVLAPTSSFVPIVSEVGAERRMYLPLAGLVTLIVIAGERLSRRIGSHSRGALSGRTIGVVATGLLVLTLGWTTRARNEDYKDAQTLWRTAIDARPDNPRAYNNLGQALHREGAPIDALRQYRRAVELDGEYSQAHFNVGLALADLGRSAEAEESYRRALELNPGLAVAQHNLGSELANSGRLDEALPHFEQAVYLSPEWARARHSLGRALRLTGDSHSAMEHLRRAAALDPQHWESRSDLAWILATDPDPSLHDPQEAVRIAERAVGLTQRPHSMALDTLAAAYAADGRFDDAIASARDAAAAALSARTRVRIEERLGLYLDGQPYRENPESSAGPP